MITYAIVFFEHFSYLWEKCFYAFECVTRTPETFTEVEIPTREGVFKGVVVAITDTPEYPVGVYKF